MQLDTYVRALLDMLAASGQPKLWELALADGRNMALELTRISPACYELCRKDFMTETRKLAAILAADVVGFSRLASTAKTGRWRGCGRFAAI
jgi:class 3 adenylate cyclase